MPINLEDALNRIKEIPDKELVAMVREALEESGIPYEVGHGQIEFVGLLSG